MIALSTFFEFVIHYGIPLIPSVSLAWLYFSEPCVCARFNLSVSHGNTVHTRYTTVDVPRRYLEIEGFRRLLATSPRLLRFELTPKRGN